jgi:hypothetical protein
MHDPAMIMLSTIVRIISGNMILQHEFGLS